MRERKMLHELIEILSDEQVVYVLRLLARLFDIN